MTTNLRATTVARPVNRLDNGRDDDWRESAACREVDPEVFFLDGLERDAKAVCRTCPVWELCLDTALTEEAGISGGGRFGVRGGMNPAERYATHRRQSRRKATTR